MNRADEIITELNLIPHPEGGYYREVFRSREQVVTSSRSTLVSRAALTSIYFLLPAHSFSRWHCVASDEVWHWCEGAPLELWVLDEELESLDVRKLGPMEAKNSPLSVVPANYWQAARTLGDYTLVSCDVGPGFDFEDFSFMSANPQLVEILKDKWPGATDLV